MTIDQAPTVIKLPPSVTARKMGVAVVRVERLYREKSDANRFDLGRFSDRLGYPYPPAITVIKRRDIWEALDHGLSLRELARGLGRPLQSCKAWTDRSKHPKDRMNVDSHAFHKTLDKFKIGIVHTL